MIMVRVRSLFTRRSMSAAHLRRKASARLIVEEFESRLVPSSLPTPDHVVIVMEENHAYSQIIGSSAAPYLNQLAQQGALFTQSFGITHPSQPNYLDFFSGSNQGIVNDNCITSRFGAANLGSELLAAGATFKSYSESMPSAGYTGCSSGNYVQKHNPASEFSNVPSADNLPFTSFPTNFDSLPAVSFVDPNILDDMHNGTDPTRIQTGDTWLRSHLDSYVSWANTHNSLLIVTWDEDDSAHGNQIPTIFVGPMVQPGQYSERINHYNILRTVEDMYGTGHAGQSANVNPITDVWTMGQQVDHFAVSVSAANPDIPGTPFDVTMTAQDVNGNTVTGYTGTVTFSSGDPYGASVPANYTFTAGDQGSHTFSGGATLYTAGTYDVTATDTTSGATGSAFVNVQAAPATGFYIQAPSSIPSGMPFDVTVYAIDPYYNVDTNYQGTITWTTTDPDGRVLLPPNYTFQARDQGQVTFPNGVTLYTPGDQFITATDISSGITGSADVTVTPGPGSSQGRNLGDLARSAAPATDRWMLAPAAVEAQGEMPAQRQDTGADRFFMLGGSNPDWLPLRRHAEAVPGFLTDAGDGLDLAAFLTDRSLDPLID
jgi:hypothetical protein